MKYFFTAAIILSSLISFGQNTIISGGNWSDTANWLNDEVANTTSEDVTTDNTAFKKGDIITVDQDFDVGSVSFFDQNLTVASNINFNLGSQALFDAGTKKNFSADNNVVLTVEAGATMIIYGDLIVENGLILDIQGELIIKGNVIVKNKADISVDGTVTVDGDFSVGNNSIIEGSGSIDVAGECNDGNTGVCQSEVLPIELLFFNTSVENGRVNLSWATASEENFDYFTIERSTDARNYEVLGTVEGNGWSEDIINYSYTDNHPLNGRAYYRLKATDLDETFEYFQPVMVNGNKYTRAIRLDNNPIGDEPVKFKLNFAPVGEMDITITNLSGREVYKGNHQPGLSIYTIDAKLDKGMYLLKVAAEGSVYTTRFLKK